MELTQVEQYESDLSEEELFEGQGTSEPTRKQRKKISKVWIKKVVFDTSTEEKAWQTSQS